MNGPILIYGDSLAEGVGSTLGRDLGSLLERELGLPVLNYGVAGDTSDLGLARLSLALREKPRLVLLILGGNDFLKRIPREQTFQNLERIITAVQEEGAIVVLVGVRSGIIGGGADREFERLAKQTGAAYVEDILQGVFGDPTLMSDAIHPNDRGYARIAERIVPLLKELLLL